MVNSVDFYEERSDLGSTLFAQTCLSENIIKQNRCLFAKIWLFVMAAFPGFKMFKIVLTLNTWQKNGHTVNFLNIWTPQKIVVITLKFETCGSTIE